MKSSGMNAKDRRPLVNSGPWCIPPDLLADNDANLFSEQRKQRKFAAELVMTFVCLRSRHTNALEQPHAHATANGNVIAPPIDHVDAAAA